MIKKAIVLICCFQVLSAPAQVNIYIEDETGLPFRLGLDGYVQNTDPVGKLVVKGLDTVPYMLNLRVDKANPIRKTIQLREKGHHHFVVSKNYRGERKLRYRGTMTALPPGVISLDLQKILPIAGDSAFVAMAHIGDPTPVATKESVPISISGPGEDPGRTETSQKEQELRDVQPTTGEVPSKPPEVPLPGQSGIYSFNDLLSDLEHTEFEFEKLIKSLEFAETNIFGTEQVRAILQHFRYDNTKLQFLAEARRKSLPGAEQLRTLKSELEYEMSHERLEQILKE